MEVNGQSSSPRCDAQLLPPSEEDDIKELECSGIKALEMLGRLCVHPELPRQRSSDFLEKYHSSQQLKIKCLQS